VQDGQLCSAELVPATGPLYLAARRLGQTAGAQQDNALQRQLVFPGHRAPDRIDHLIACDLFRTVAPDLMYRNEIYPPRYVTAPGDGPALEDSSSAISTLLPRPTGPPPVNRN